MGPGPGSKKWENVSIHLAVCFTRVVSLAALLVYSVPVNAAAEPGKDATRGLELICLTEQPAIVEGEIATVKAWVSTFDGQPVTTPIEFEWGVDAGRIEAQVAATLWNLSTVKVPLKAVRKVHATVTATSAGGSKQRCVVEVLIGKKYATTPDRGILRGESLLSAKRYLLPGDVEAPGYGLYSYLLFSAPPKDDEERARYLKTIEAYLLVLQDVDDYLRRHVRRRSLNVTYIPLKEMPAQGNSNAEWAANVLAAYDYAAAQILLNRVKQGHQRGPYLLSVLQPLSEPGEPAHLWEDLTGVVPELAWDWISFFTYLAAQQRSWNEDSLQRFALTLRNLIAVGGKVTPDLMKVLQEVIRFKPGE